ncbi:MAG TPA: alpha/beta hydrolase [Burkholderiales bacterium]|nr:alpha/beta hydrolase [Burkholderiales bacterium]
MRALASFVGMLVFGYAVLVALVWAIQDRLIYFPERTLAATPRALGVEYEEVSIAAEDGVRLHGWFVPAPNPRATVLFLHGNGGNISHRLDKLAIFRRLALNVFIFDYRGYGRSEGRSDEEGTYRDARAAWNYLTQSRALPASDVVMYGESLGGAVALRLALEHAPRALIVDSSFTSVPALGGELYPWLPVRWISRFQYAGNEAIAKLHVPVLVIHSRMDEIVPFRHGEQLFAAANEPKRFLEIRGGHNDGFLASGGQYVGGIDAFLAAHLRKR